MLHAADVEALQQLKKTSQQDAARKRELEEELEKTTALLQEKTSNWNTIEKQLKVSRPDDSLRDSFFLWNQNNELDFTCPQEEQSNLSRRCEELGKQNALLHQQMDEMAARSQQLQPQQQNQDLSFSEEGKSIEQILEILR